MQKPQIISFDAADTLIKLTRSIGEHYTSVAATHGVHANAELVNKCFYEVFSKTPPLGQDGSKGLDWWKDVIERTFQKAGFEKQNFNNFDNFAEELYNALAEERVWLTYPDVEPTLKELHNKGFRLIVFSNFDERLVKVLADLKILNYFERVICSTQIGFAKPDKQAFLKVAELMKAEAKHILHVGDGFENDYTGALRADFQALFLNRKQFQVHQLAHPEEEINSLSEVIELVQ